MTKNTGPAPRKRTPCVHPVLAYSPINAGVWCVRCGKDWLRTRFKSGATFLIVRAAEQRAASEQESRAQAEGRAEKAERELAAVRAELGEARERWRLS